MFSLFFFGFFCALECNASIVDSCSECDLVLYYIIEDAEVNIVPYLLQNSGVWFSFIVSLVMSNHASGENSDGSFDMLP